MSDIFISYSREDRVVAAGLAACFAQWRWSVWWDRELNAGAAFAQEIARQLDEARAVVVLWSRASITSTWVIDEAARAERRIVPVLLEPVRPPLPFGSLHTLDLSRWDGNREAEEFQALIRALSRVLAADAGRPAVSLTPLHASLRARGHARTSRWAWLAALGAIAGVLLIALLIASGSREQTPVATGSQPINSTLETPKPLKTSDIVGSWDSKKANELVWAKINATVWPPLLSSKDTVKTCNPKHEPVGEYSLLYPTTESKLVILASVCEGSECHACAPDLSLFQFDKVAGGWNLVNSDLAVVPWGQWGKLESGVSARVIGTNRFGLVLEGSGIGGGEVASTLHIWARISDAYREILDLTTSDDTEANPTIPLSNWKADLSVDDSGTGDTGFFKLKVVRKGVEAGKKLLDTQVWVFDGQKYRQADSYQ